MNRFVVVTIMSTFASTVGCTADAPPKTPDAAPTKKGSTDTSTAELPGKDPKKAGIVIGPKLAKLCSIPTTNFDFDSAALSDGTKAALDALAKCFTDGPAKTENMRLVGHTDPRGDEEYNLALGHKRAAAVGDYLTDAGVDEERIEMTSEGKLHATGTDEDGWAKDRKVEIFLADAE